MARPVSAILRTIERAVPSVAEKEEQQEDENDGTRKEKDQGEVH